jgi:hypothetical protein
MNKNTYRLEITNAISAQGNLLIFSVFLKQFNKKNMKLEVIIPSKIINLLDAKLPEFNIFFSDILLDSGFLDENLNISISNIDYFSVKIN